MCGIVGLITADRGSTRRLEIIEDFIGRIEHRGPDDSGSWIDENTGVALGHRRLAIIDLSDAGHQPMVSPSSRWVLTYNGEIYNFRDLRAELARRGCQFRGHSDTEVLLQAVDSWGVQDTLGRLNGMYALALWDRRDRQLTLARDPLGEKPLYHGWAGADFVFASELGALRAHPDCPHEIDRAALAALLRYKFIPAPRTILDGISKLGAGQMLTLRPEDGPQSIRISHHWDARRRAREAFSDQLVVDDAVAVDELERHLQHAVGLRTFADVPVGAFLSGGIDSSTIVAMLTSAGSSVRTYSIGFSEAELDEAPYAAEIAQHLGTDHTELYCGPSELLDVIPRLPQIYSEPFADSSQIPTAVVCELARRHVKVVLSGDGGDELFGGYGRYERTESAWPVVTRTPPWVRRPLGTALGWFGTRFPTASAPDWRILPDRIRRRALGVAFSGRARGLRASSFNDFYHDVLSDWTDPAQVVKGLEQPDWSAWPGEVLAPTRREEMMLTDLVTYLPEDILVKVDRASMAVGLEVRVPLLDTNLVDFSWRLPANMKLRGGVDKWILRQVAHRHIPPHMLDRPKQGFGAPIDEWLRGPLEQWAGDLLSPRSAGADHLDFAVVQRIWDAHRRGRGNWSRWLWSILMFQTWAEEWQRATR